MKKENIITKEGNTIIKEFGKKKLLTYAGSFKDLANTFYQIPEEDSGEDNRMAYLWKRRLMENRNILAEHLNEVADIITEVAEETFLFIPIEDKLKRKIYHNLKDQKIELLSFYMFQNNNNRYEISAVMMTKKGSTFTVEEIADMISVVLNKRFMPIKGSISLLHNKEETIIFQEETLYEMMTGVARAIKEQETISGDNFSVTEIGNGKVMVALSDGMGSGEKACADSEMVIELFEKFMEANFSKDIAVQMINGALIASGEDQNMSTLDVCQIDLYTGICEFLKVGAATTYIKSDLMIEQILSGNFPLGVFHQMEIELLSYQLSHGDYIIMVTDGVTECYDCLENDFLLEDFIRNITLESPREMANAILNQVIHHSKGKIQDDMTVLVIGIWENTP